MIDEVDWELDSLKNLGNYYISGNTNAFGCLNRF